jgi:DNA-binding transcriptional LysR family regulator
MDVQWFDTFLTVARLGGITAAARSLGRAQSTVSMQIKGVEDYFGVVLIDREGRNFSLTPAGVWLQPVIEGIVAELAQARTKVQQLVPGYASIRLGASTTPAEFLVPKLFAQFHQHQLSTGQNAPLLDVSVANSQTIMDRVLQGEVNLGFVGANPERSQALEKLVVATDEILIAVKRSHPLVKLAADNSPEFLPALAKTPWISREVGSATRAIAEDALARIAPEGYLMSFDTNHAIINALLYSDAATALSRHLLQDHLATGALVALGHPDLPLIKRDFYLIWRKGAALAPAEQAFLKWLHATLTS